MSLDTGTAIHSASPDIFFTTPQHFAARDLAHAISRTSPLTDRKGHDVIMSYRQFAEHLTDDRLTYTGQAFKAAVHGRIFIDMGSGNPTNNVFTRATVLTLGASHYVGVDMNMTYYLSPKFAGDARRNHEYLEFRSQDSTFIASDMADFLEQNPPPGVPVTFLFAGIETRAMKKLTWETHAVPYVTRVHRQLSQKTRTGDIIIVGRATRWLHPEKIGFMLREPVRHSEDDNIAFLQIWEKI